MKKRIFTLALTLALLLTLSVPALARTGKTESAPEEAGSLPDRPGSLIHEAMAPDITKKDMTFYLCRTDDTRTLPVYFVGGSDVPHVSLRDWAEMYGHIMRTYVDKGDTPQYDLTFSIDGQTAVLTRSDGDPYTMTVDCASDTITFLDFDAFFRLEPDRVLLDVLEAASSRSDEARSLFKRTPGSYERYGDEVVIDAGAYGIDFVSDGQICYMPLQTLGDILLSHKYVNVFCNGETVCFVRYGELKDGSGELTDLGKIVYSVPKGRFSEAMGRFNYAELCLAFDTLYGLREVHGFRNFEDLVNRVGAREALSGTDPNQADSALYAIIELHLDDLHSAWRMTSPLSEDTLQAELREKVGRGRSDMALRDQMETFFRARKAAYPDKVPGYEEIGNTAYITFDQFAPIPEGTDYYESAPTEENTDTIGLMIYAYSRIMRENSPVENVVLDLACNTGGDSDTAVFTLAAFLGDGYASVTDTLSGALATGVYNVDINLDGRFDEKDWGLRNKKRFCLISPVSFSCGNLVPNVFKNSRQVTLIGQTSGGGSCAVLPLTSACGAYFQISGFARLAFTKNGSFYDIDRGAEPDFPLAFPESYFDRAALTEYINSLR